MLARWFRKRSAFAAADAATRLAAVRAAELDNPQHVEALTELARTDPDGDVRIAATRNLSDSTVLQRLLDDAAVATAAAARLAELALASTPLNREMLAHAAVLNAALDRVNSAQASELLTFLTDADAVVRLTLATRETARDTALAHALFRSEAGLVQLERASRGKDKACNRHARSRLDALRGAQRTHAAAAERIAELDAAITKDLDGYEPEDAVRRNKLRQLASMRATVVNEAETALATLRAFDDAPAPPPTSPLAEIELDAPAVTEAAADPAAPATPQQTALDALQNHFQSARTLAPDAAFSATSTALLQAWQAAAAASSPSVEQQETAANLEAQLTRIDERLQRLAAPAWQDPDTAVIAALEVLQGSLPEAPREALDGAVAALVTWRRQHRARVTALAWPEDVKQPQTVEAAAERADVVEAALTEGRAELTRRSEQAETACEQALAAAQKAIDDGKSQHAVQAVKRARAALAELRQQDRRQPLERTVNSLSAQLDELRDWQKFATDPKRTPLLEELEKLVSAPLDPPAQAERLRELRSQWQQLGPPTSAAAREQLGRFDELAEQAFEPCKAFYAEQAEVRAANLRARESLCEQLALYLESTDWDNADMQAAAEIMRAAREEWRRHHPCDRKALKAVQQRFETLQGALHEKVKKAGDKQAERKRALIARARQLVDLEDGSAKAEEAKRLQQQWREIQGVPRALDQRLWREFRTVCDEIFASRDAARQAARDAESSRLDALAALVAACEQSVSDAEIRGQADAGAQAQLTALEDALNADRSPASLRKRAQAADARYRALLKQVKQGQRLAELARWREWDEAMSRAEQAGEPLEAAHAVFKARADGQAEPADWQQMTLAAEIAADLPSPPELQAERMALQIEMMNQGMRGGARDASLGDPYTQVHAWCAAGPKTAEADALRERFFSAIAARLG